MYVSPISTRLVRGRSTPAIRAIVLSLPLLVFLVRADHAHHAAATHDLALVANPFDRRSYFHSLPTILPRVTSVGESSIRTRSPTRIRTKLRSIRSAMCAVTNAPCSSRTRYNADGSCSVTVPVRPATCAPEPALLSPSESMARPP